jgi:hypothetical protein
MIGYREVLKAVMDCHEVKRVFVYVDACPYRKGVDCLPIGVILIEPDDGVDLSFVALNGITVHLIGGDESRVRQFADRIHEFMPAKIIANWGEAMEITE